ncbi:hypothetical protein RB200_40015 [Streptomyces sp. PmtG]
MARWRTPAHGVEGDRHADGDERGAAEVEGLAQRVVEEEHHGRVHAEHTERERQVQQGP